jgi:hypothetical protein
MSKGVADGRGGQSTALALLAIVLSGLVGCQAGVQWDYYRFPPAYEESRQTGEPLFVYFHDWASPRSMVFEDEVLLDPAVLAETQNFLCVVLQWNTPSDQPIARELGIEALPGVALVGAERRVLASLDGEISMEELLDAMRGARDRLRDERLRAPTRR